MNSRQPARDHFPTTHATWISERVGMANDEVARHVMERYFEPLRTSVKGSSLRNFGDSADLVNDFFAERRGAATRTTSSAGSRAGCRCGDGC